MATKPKWIKAFIETLRACGVVHRSCEVARIARSTAYSYKESHPDFAQEWADAEADYADALEAEAFRRAKEGTLKPIYYKGEQVGDVREYSDTLMVLLLKGAKPEKYKDRATVETVHSGGLVVNAVVSKMSDDEIDKLQEAARLLQEKREA